MSITIPRSFIYINRLKISFFIFLFWNLKVKIILIIAESLMKGLILSILFIFHYFKHLNINSSSLLLFILLNGLLLFFLYLLFSIDSTWTSRRFELFYWRYLECFDRFSCSFASSFFICSSRARFVLITL